MHAEQLRRIKAKLAKAKARDRFTQVFGAESHKYLLNPPASVEEVEAFEKRYKVALPRCYRSFLLEIGNGGTSFGGAGAGPFYGIYPLGNSLEELVDHPENVLHRETILAPDMHRDEWHSLTKTLDDDHISDDEYTGVTENLWSGVLPLGSQGCTYMHVLILTGNFAGRVVNIDTEFQQPRFCFEDNFLDWYERWLDEVINGSLITDDPTWFGYTMGGDVTSLLDIYDSSNTEYLRQEALRGMLKQSTAERADCKRLVTIATTSQVTCERIAAVQLLTKFDYSRAKPFLKNLFLGDEADVTSALRFIFWYAKEHKYDWTGELHSVAEGTIEITQEDTLRFLVKLCELVKLDYIPALLRNCDNENVECRAYAISLLGKESHCSRYLPQFKTALSDESPKVIYNSLQALKYTRSDDLLEEYRRIAGIYSSENGRDYIHATLKIILTQYGYRDIQDFIEKFDNNITPIPEFKRKNGSVKALVAGDDVTSLRTIAIVAAMIIALLFLFAR